MKLISIISVVFLVSILSGLPSCSPGNKNSDESSKLDSLQRVADTKSREYEDLSMFMSAISRSLDSINYAENMLIKVSNPESGHPDREEIKAKINLFSQVLQRQKERIAVLTDSLNSKNSGTTAEHINKYKSLIEFLNQQLDAKDQQLKNLQAQLASSKANVAQLSRSVQSLKSNVASLETKNEMLDQALVSQNDAINEGYIKIGTKKQLEAAGLLTKGGLFKKRKVNYSGLAGGGFQRIDIRYATSIPISGKKAKLLTPAPGGSYTLKRSDDDHWILIISNPASFWSASSYCIIQTD